MSIDCLLDTNSIVKRYHAEPGTEIIDYLFDKSPSAIINFVNLQVAEVIKTFHSLRAQNKINSDEILRTLIDTFLKEIDDGKNNGKIKLYEFASEHLKDLDVYAPIFRIPQPKISFWDGIRMIKRKKKRADTIDALMLIIMREIHYHTQESYLVTSDEHVLDIAKSFNLRTINPETMKIRGVPKSLDARAEERISKQLKVVCCDPVNRQPLGSTSTIDICKNGICVRSLINLTQGRNVAFRISRINKESPIIESNGQVIWSDKKAAGIRFSASIPNDLYTAISQN
jgi:hypothetical protein